MDFLKNKKLKMARLKQYMTVKKHPRRGVAASSS
jgi:hypothetical protein